MGDKEITLETAKKDLKDCMDVQCGDGNWNYDPYMHGMANGLILAMSLLDGKEPEFLHAPEKFLCDIKDKRKEKLLDKLRSIKEQGCFIPDGTTHVDLNGEARFYDFEKHVDGNCFFWNSCMKDWVEYESSKMSTGSCPLSVLTAGELAEFMPKASPWNEPAPLVQDAAPAKVFPAAALAVDTTPTNHLGGRYG